MCQKDLKGLPTTLDKLVTLPRLEHRKAQSCLIKLFTSEEFKSL